jgi:hypothetical protein
MSTFLLSESLFYDGSVFSFVAHDGSSRRTPLMGSSVCVLPWHLKALLELVDKLLELFHVL